MSHATLYVRFPDGEVRYGWYDGTNDVMLAPLYDDPREVWDERPTVLAGGRAVPDGEPVRIACDYGGGSSWSGWATRAWITSGPRDNGPYENGLPGWAVYPGREPRS